MKKILIGAIVGGIIIFIWQFLSWSLLHLHYDANQYTPRQDTILAHLRSQFSEDGQYLMPTAKKDASMEERQTLMKSAEGKPWAIVTYHNEMKETMTMNMVRGVFVNILSVALLCWILSKMTAPLFGTVFMTSLFAGLIGFLNGIYTQHIWYGTFDLMAHFIDVLVMWGTCGLWLGWLYGRK